MLALGRVGASYLFRFPRRADFLFDPSSRVLRPFPSPEFDLQNLRQLLLDNVLPLVLSRRCFLVLHGGAVLIDDQAVAFLGESGAGKSTLTAAFVSHGRPLVTDDCLALEESRRGVAAFTSHPGLKLWPDSAESTFGPKTAAAPVRSGGSKLRVRAPGVAPPERSPLRRIYLLSRGPRISVAAPRKGDAFIGIVQNTQILDPTDPAMLKASFERIGRLLEKVPVRGLTYPRSYSRIGAVREAVLKDLER